MRKIKAGLHWAQVTNSILVIMVHGDIIDFSEINLVSCCYPLLYQRELDMKEEKEEEEILTGYVSHREVFSKGSNNVCKPSLSRSWRLWEFLKTFYQNSSAMSEGVRI